MNIKIILSSVLAAGLLAGCASEKCEGCKNGGDAKQSKLMAQAKVSKEAAQQAALAKVPRGTVKNAELEKEKGKLIWSFDIALPDSKDIKEVNVDAITGAVVGDVETETPEIQAKEAAEDAAKAKKGEDKD